ncbi:BspA family leucine-rich repeat surface protein [Campylobacter jejuni]|nr:BspA family leucine-rich repeat surface protein [Campylobacter jejuni]EAJ5228612.1 BspA family leucine-rich repeat surface protein [Campylobacter jejuni]EAK1477123.1 BspA family leucine-rich repeat surface protein [Campylobacter jejuni]EFP0097704.1 BspA family leucine-rich repeat surface protein [Campylobacter jejuni]EHD9229538.1 BspA family leucine-rich repeat surface protein [Campylobacter jejuni]
MFELSNELALSFEKIGLYFFIFIISIQTLFIFWSFITSFDFCKKYWKESITFGLKTLMVEKFKKDKVITVVSQNPKILIIDNTMEDLLVLKKESFIVEEVKIIKKYKYTPKTKEELQALVKDESIYLGDIDTSEITDMSYLFTGSTRTNFSGIEKWNTGKVKTMRSMFECNKFFNEDIGAWDVGDVRDMAWMFLGCENFNQPLNGWDVRNVEYRYGMFYESGMERDDSKKPRFEKE